MPIHIYSNNANLTIHLNFAEDVAQSYLNQIREVIKEKTALLSTTEAKDNCVV